MRRLFESLDFSTCRLEDISDAAIGHAADAGQRATHMLLRFLHIWNLGRTALGWHAAPEVLHD